MDAEKFEAFIEDLRKLCLAHGVVISSSLFVGPGVFRRTGDEDPVESLENWIDKD